MKPCIARRTNAARSIVLGALCCLMLACKQEKAPVKEDTGVEDLTIVVEADKSRILQEEQSLQEKRDSFEQERQRLGNERQDLEQKLASLTKKDKRQRDELEAQQRRLEEEDRQVRDRAKNFDTQRQKLEDDKNKLLDRISKLTATKGGLTIEQRENLIAQREKSVAEREARVATREAEAGRRIEDLTRAMNSLQASGGITKTVVVNNASGATSQPATKANTEKTRRQLRARMDAKGVLLDDLPPATKTLWKNASQALDDKDYASASESYTEIERVVNGIVVNGDFVKAKMGRINRDATKKANEATQRQINALLAEVSDAMTDGRYDRANRKINQIVALAAEK